MEPTDTSDRDLQRRLRSGDEGAFDSVFRTHYPHLVRMGESIVHERALAEEIAQEVMLELWRRHESLQLEQGFRAYLMRATRNRALNYVRHQQVVTREATAAALDPRSSPSGEDEMLSAELERAIQDAIRDLPDKSREVFQLSREHGLKYVEIAAALDISVKTVEKRMGLALAHLRERLATWL